MVVKEVLLMGPLRFVIGAGVHGLDNLQYLELYLASSYMPDR